MYRRTSATVPVPSTSIQSRSRSQKTRHPCCSRTRPIREIAWVALNRGVGTRGLRSVVEEVLESVSFDAEAGVRYVATDKTVRGGEAVKHKMSGESRLKRRMRDAGYQ